MIWDEGITGIFLFSIARYQDLDVYVLYRFDFDFRWISLHFICMHLLLMKRQEGREGGESIVLSLCCLFIKCLM